MAYTYTKDTPGLVWNVTHNLNTLNPVVDVWVDDNGNTTAVLPKQVRIIDADKLEITFTVTTNGVAVIN
jgi:hypothetical protein